MKDKTCCFTGHRPEELKRNETQVKEALERAIEAAVSRGFTHFISGMARGVDLWAAQLVLELKKQNPDVKLLCAVPYENFEKRWSPAWRQCYHDVLAAADYKKVFYPSFSYAAFQERNRWMVDHSALVIAVCNGMQGGTLNTIDYAERQNVRVFMIPG